MSESKIELWERKVRNGQRKEPAKRNRKEQYILWRKLSTPAVKKVTANSWDDSVRLATLFRQALINLKVN